jgi:hypothetical protein
MNNLLPANFVVSTTATIADTFAGLAPLLTLIIGIMLLGALIAIIIGAIRG